jgi:RNA polymerase sigma factor (sigma-70 family)
VSDSLATYIQAFSRYPLLSAQREILLAKQVQRLPALRRIPPEQRSSSEQRELRAAERARRMMVSCNLRLVVSVARGYRADHLSLQDLIQEGNLGLLRAVEKFDPTLGYRFSTYASWWIRQGIVRAIANKDRTIRLPAHTASLRRRVRVAAEQLRRRGVAQPSLRHIALEAELDVEAVAHSLLLAARVRSLDAAAPDDGPSLVELLPAEGGDPYEQLERSLRLRQLRARLHGLPDTERTVLERRYLGGEPLRPQQVGEQLGLTADAVRVVEKRAIRRLRHQLRRCRP